MDPPPMKSINQLKRELLKELYENQEKLSVFLRHKMGNKDAVRNFINTKFSALTLDERKVANTRARPKFDQVDRLQKVYNYIYIYIYYL